MSTPEPIATGNLAKTPLPHLLVYLEQNKLSGTLAIWPDSVDGAAPQGQDRILLLKGRPVAGRLIQPTQNLKDGLLPLFARVNAPYAFYESNLLGDDRVSGRVDPLALIAESLRSSAREDVVATVLARYIGVPLKFLPTAELGRYMLQPDERALIDLLKAGPTDLTTLVAGSGLDEVKATRLVYLLAITKAIAPAEDAQPAGAAPAPAAPVAAVAPAPVAAPPPAAPAPVAAPPPAAAAPVAAPPPAAAAPAHAAPAPAQAVQVEVSGATPEAPATPATSGTPSDAPLHAKLDRLNSIPPPPDHLSEDHRAQWLRVVTRGRLIENQNYFEMLGVKRDAKSADARSKFYQLAKDWHPDRQPPELSAIREYVQIIFSYMSEAHNTLGDEEERVKYVQNVREGGGTPAAEKLMQTILDMAMEYERVMVLARKHEYEAALGLLSRILLVIKDEADYHAMHAWLLQQRFPGRDAPIDQIIESCDAALELREDHERANMIKAQLLRNAGRHDESLAYFKKVADINPHNIEAVREVRIATMRAQGKLRPNKAEEDDEGGVGGLIGKFFKKK